jgi:hypothetical protein
MNKIISVDKQRGNRARWDLYIIHYEDKDEEKYDVHVFKEEYDVIMFKRHLLDIGVSEIDLDKYEELLHAQWDREISLEMY